MFGFFKKHDSIGDELVDAIRCFIGTEGIDKFTAAYEKYGTLNPVDFPGQYPNAILFKEGIRVRNYMRTFHKNRGIVDWTDRDYDNRWEEATLRACDIKWVCPEINKRN